MNYHGGKLTKNEWQKVEDLLVADEHNELGLMVLSQDNNGNLLVLNRFWTGSKLHSLVKIPHADSIAAVKDQSKWEKYDLKQVPANTTQSNNFAVVSDSTILIAGALYDATDHVLWMIIRIKRVCLWIIGQRMELLLTEIKLVVMRMIVFFLKMARENFCIKTGMDLLLLYSVLKEIM